MRLLVSGSRHYKDLPSIEKAILGVVRDQKDVTVIHGECSGVDKTSTIVATKHGFKVESHPPDWKKFGKAAGPIRNEEMIKSKIDHAVLFLSQDSKGTRHMLTLVQRYKVPYTLVSI